MSLEIAEKIEFDKVCRSCLSNKGEMRSIYGSCLDDMLRRVTQVQVVAGDGLPEGMCFQCVLQVSRAFRFKQQCERADVALRSYLARKASENQISNLAKQNIQNEFVETEEEDSENCLIPRTSSSDPLLADDQMPDVQRSSQIGDTLETHRSEENYHANFCFKQVNLGECLERMVDVEQEDKSKLAKIPLGTHTVELESLTRRQNSATFECNVCNKNFAKKQILSRHLKIHNPIKPHVCKDCGMRFTESSNLTKHRKKHTGELRNVIGKPNLCTVCGRGFKWASSLSKHMNHHTKRKILNCPHCPKYYLESQTLKLHLRTHTGERPFVCKICDKSFTQMCNLEKHLRIHTGEKPYVCPICGKHFTQSGYIAIHMRSHTGEKPYICNVCGKCFGGSNTLAMHERIHTGEKPYTCNICSKTFARLETATVHQRTHTGEKPHYCSICNRAFISSSHLSNHKKTHIRVKPYNCLLCDKKFSSYSGFKIHRKSHDKEESSLVCNSFGKKCDESTEFIEDELIHSAIIVFSENNIDTVDKVKSTL